MFTITLDENSPRVLRATASYLLVLAGDIGAEITGADRPVLVGTTEQPAFTKAELAEADALGKVQPPPSLPTAAEAFGAAPSIAAVETSTTAPVVTTATTSIPTPPAVPVPPAPTVVSEVSDVAYQTLAHAVDVDARGLPWDSRIHSGGKTKLKNGNWVNKRGVDESVVKTIEAQLSAVMAIPSSSPAPAASVPAPPSIPTPPASPTVAPTATTASPSSFAGFMQKVLRLTQVDKTLTQEQLTAILVSKGIDSLPALAPRPDLIPEIDALIDATVLMS
jgi:hypothetical protein